ncbi:hypothetical protein B0H13DRAFT_2336964 [Mycena leptocephala]|nr:hypothetical protein B0H13DRAFT_2336964 [Mycena leptocephala]
MMPLDMTRDRLPSFHTYRDARPTQSTLTSLNVCTSPIQDGRRVAQFLSGLFPRLAHVSVAVEWNWMKDLSEVHPMFEEIEQHRTWYASWDVVSDLLSYFAAARAEEQYCAGMPVPVH